MVVVVVVVVVEAVVVLVVLVLVDSWPGKITELSSDVLSMTSSEGVISSDPPALSALPVSELLVTRRTGVSSPT